MQRQSGAERRLGDGDGCDTRRDGGRHGLQGDRDAAEAVTLIEVGYEMLPAVLDVREAMREDAPLLDERRRTKSMAGSGDKPSNVATHLQLAHGDPEAGFAAADIVIEREFTTRMV